MPKQNARMVGINRKDLTIALNDVDFCLRVHTTGYRNIFTPNAMMYHHESISRGTEDTPEKQKRFSQEVKFMINQYDVLNKNKLPVDLFYNPNLTSAHENFSINSDINNIRDGIEEHDRAISQASFYKRNRKASL